MSENKLFTLFARLVKTEKLRLGKFLDSPYHNQREDVRVLYRFCKQWNWEKGMPAERMLFAEVYPAVPFDKVQLRLVMSYLTKRIEAFIVLEAMKESSFEQEMSLLQFYQQRGLTKGFQDVLRSAERNTQRSTFREANFFYRQFRIQERKFTTPSERSDKEFKSTLQELSDNLDYFYLFSKLKYACGILSHQQLFKVEYETRMMEEVVACVEREELWHIPAIGIFYFAYQMLMSDQGERFFQRLMDQIHTDANALLESEVKSVYLLAINFCIRQVNLGQEVYRQQLFDLYLDSLDRGFLLEGGELLPWSYKNIVSIGLKLKAHEAVEQFVEQYQLQLPEEHRESFYRYGRAELQLSRGAFRQVIEVLHPVQFKDPLMALNARITMIKAYFELQEIDLIEYLLDSFKHFLKRKEMLNYHRENYKLFAGFCLSLIQLGPDEREKRVLLRERVLAAQKLVGKEWLLSKLG